ncbi:MAG: cupin domain-containing protein [Candidatus Binataceae bacterium]
MADSPHHALDLPLMSFATEQEIAKLKASDQWRRESRAALTLVKTHAVTIVLVALHAGAILKEHHAEGPITVAVLEGAIRFKARGEERVLRRDGLLALGDAIQHEVEALEESAFVLTVNQAAKPS